MGKCATCCCYLCNMAGCDVDPRIAGRKEVSSCQNYIDYKYILQNLKAGMEDRRNVGWMLELLKTAIDIPWMQCNVLKVLKDNYIDTNFKTVSVKDGAIRSIKGNIWKGIS